MANMPTPNQLLAAAKATGFPVVEMAGWRGRCRCHNGNHERGERPAGRAFGPWHGTTVHQTAGPRLTGARAVQYVQNILIGGNGHVPGPLSQYGIGGDGTIYMVAAGRCNHAGRISQAGLNAMRAASFSLTGNHNLRGSGLDGNRYTVGMELLMNGGTLRDTPTDPQRSAAVALSAELSRLAKRSGRETHGHGEVSLDRGFTDPGFNMGRFRADVMARVSTNQNYFQREFGMSEKEVEQLFERVLDRKLRQQGIGPAGAGAYWGSSFANNAGHAAAHARNLDKGGVRAQVNAGLWDALIPGADGIAGSSVRNNIHHIEFRTAWLVEAVAGIARVVGDLAKHQGATHHVVQLDDAQAMLSAVSAELLNSASEAAELEAAPDDSTDVDVVDADTFTGDEEDIDNSEGGES